MSVRTMDELVDMMKNGESLNIPRPAVEQVRFSLDQAGVKYLVRQVSELVFKFVPQQ